MVSIFEKAVTIKAAVVTSICPSKLVGQTDERYFIINNIPRKSKVDSFDEELRKYDIWLKITDLSDPRVQGAIKGYVEASKVLKSVSAHNDDEFLHVNNPISPPAHQMFRGLVGGAASRQPDSPGQSAPMFGGGSSPMKLAGGRVEESKHQGAARLDN